MRKRKKGKIGERKKEKERRKKEVEKKKKCVTHPVTNKWFEIITNYNLGLI